MNDKKIKTTAQYFVVRRAFRHGSVTRADLIRAFGISSATATRLMTEIINRCSNLLERKGHAWIPKPLVTPPDYATEQDLLKHLDTQRHNPVDIGLFEGELPLIYVSWTNSLPRQSGILQTIIKAIGKNKQIDIVYVGLRENEQPRARKILPLALEKMNDQWRVIAQDLEESDFPIKVFVLSRIMDVSMSLHNKRLPYIKGHTDKHIYIKVKLDDRFSNTQKEILQQELKINEGIIRIAKRSEHEFKRRFTSTPASENAVWPPLILKENQ